MKPLCTLLFLGISYFSFSQCLSTDPNVYGAIDFTDTLFKIEKYVNLGTGSTKISYLKDNNNDGIPEINPNMKDVRYPKTTKDETCNPTTYDSTLNPATITYEVYYPKTRISNGADVTGCKFPAIILFHGGGFADCNGGGGDASNLGIIAQEFAKRGYVAFVVEYRTGRYLAPPYAPLQSFLTAQQSLAEYRAFQDARGAVRSIIWHQQQRAAYFSNDPYQVDINKIFIGGNSAGSIIALHTAYYNADQIRDVFPTPAGNPTIAQSLGAIDIDYYYGAPTIEYQSKIKGVLNMWGQMGFPKSYNTNNTFANFWADYGNTNIPPMIAFHGDSDMTVQVGKAPIKFAPNKFVNGFNYTPYNMESHSLLSTSPGPYQLDPTTSSIDLYGQGSKGIYSIFLTLGISNETYIDCNAAHGLDSPKDVADNGGVFKSNYGTAYTTAADVNVYIVQRAVTYFPGSTYQ